jgi:hypothetical protein
VSLATLTVLAPQVTVNDGDLDWKISNFGFQKYVFFRERAPDNLRLVIFVVT